MSVRCSRCASFVSRRRSFLLAAVAALAAPCLAEADVVLEVSVIEAPGKPLAGATVQLAGTGRVCSTDSTGLCRFEALAPGRYDVSVRLAGFGTSRAEVLVKDGAPARLPVSLAPEVHRSESVTVSPDARDTFESYQPATVLAGGDLAQTLAANLGETLGSQTGVNVRAFGPGPSRPVIRGLDGDRVLILENGARTGDLSSQSADHAVNIDPTSATQVEVVRGPATLLYGSSALGGVVNVLSDEIPTHPVRNATGAVTLMGGTANDEAGVAGNVALGNGRWAVQGRRLGESHRRRDDPGRDDPEHPVPDEGRRRRTRLHRRQRLPRGLVPVRRQPLRRAVRGRGRDAAQPPPPPRRPARRAPEPGRLHRGAEVRGRLPRLRSRRDRGQRGDRHQLQERVQRGPAAAQPRAARPPQGDVRLLGNAPQLQLGGRGGARSADHAEHLRRVRLRGAELQPPVAPVRREGGPDGFSPDGAAVDRPELTDRDFTEFSGSLGLVGRLRDELTLAANLARAARNPSLEELYNHGPHAGNFAFEIGNPDLVSEKGLGLDVSLRYRSRRLHAELTWFRNSIDDYIFPFQTGEVRGRPAGRELQVRGQQLQGFEAHVDVGFSDSLWLELGGDAVRGELRATARRFRGCRPTGAGSACATRRAASTSRARSHGGEQDRVYGAETPTDGYTVVNLHASYTFASGAPPTCHAARRQSRRRDLPQPPVLHQGPRAGDGAQPQARLHSPLLIPASALRRAAASYRRPPSRPPPGPLGSGPAASRAGVGRKARGELLDARLGAATNDSMCPPGAPGSRIGPFSSTGTNTTSPGSGTPRSGAPP